MLYREYPGMTGKKTVARLTALLFALALVLQPAAVSAAPDVYNIANTNAAGVSNNRVAQFNVGANGLVLVNAATDAASQLAGGNVAGNANLTNGPARVILFQVTGSGASALNGATEIAGQRAAFVLANANGITVNGAKFINAGRVVLTTGTPRLDSAGNLKDFAVKTGTITVEGAGLDAAGTDRVDLISRAAVINAQITNGKELTVVAGANKVNYSTMAVNPTGGIGAAPAVAIDVTALGGMFADKITMVATERGVGVNSQGTINATAGDLVITANGKVGFRQSSTSASGAITVAGQAVEMTDASMDAGGNIGLKATTGNVTNTDYGMVFAGGDIAVDATGSFVNTQGSMMATGAFAVKAASLVNTDFGTLSSGGDFTIRLGYGGSYYGSSYKCHSGGSGYGTPSAGPYTLNNTDGFINAGGNLAIAVKSQAVGAATANPVFAVDNTRGMMSAGNNLTIDVEAAKAKGYCGTASGTAFAVNNTDGYMSAGNDLIITAKDGGEYYGAKCGGYGGYNYYWPSSNVRTNYLINNTNGNMTAGNDIAITVQGATKTQTYRFGGSKCHGGGYGGTVTTAQLTVDNTNGYISAGNNLTIATQGIVNNAGGTITAVNTAIIANDVLNAAGTINGDTSVTIKTNKVFNRTAGTVSGGTITYTRI